MKPYNAQEALDIMRGKFPGYYVSVGVSGDMRTVYASRPGDAITTESGATYHEAIAKIGTH